MDKPAGTASDPGILPDPVAKVQSACTGASSCVMTLGLALVAGVASFAAGEAIHSRYAAVDYRNLPRLDRSLGPNARPLAERMQEVRYASDDATFGYATLGSLLGLA